MKTFKDSDLSNKNYNSKDLSHCQFLNCNLSGVSFANANLENTYFFECRVEDLNPVSFEGANLNNAKIDECIFDNSIFRNVQLINSSISNSKFRRSNFIGCRFNRALIENIDISKSQLHLTSFIDSQILSITFEPSLKIPYLRGLRYFKITNQIYRTIFINHNDHLSFTEFCHLESRKDKLFSKVQSGGILTRSFKLLFLNLFGILTNYGNSLTRWFICVLFIIFSFSLVIFLSYDSYSYLDTIKISGNAFFNFGSPPEQLELILFWVSIFGYFMLGILITLLTVKVSAKQ